MDKELVTAVEMVGNDRVKARAFRAALREQKFPWHQHNARWTVRKGSSEHEDMRSVLAKMPWASRNA